MKSHVWDSFLLPPHEIIVIPSKHHQRFESMKVAQQIIQKMKVNFIRGVLVI
jgi:hypothetical protein